MGQAFKHQSILEFIEATHRVDGDNGACHREQIEKLRDRSDLVRFVGDLSLAKHQTLAARERRDLVDRRLGTTLLIGASERLAPGLRRGRLDGDDIRPEFRERSNPGNEAALEGLGIEFGNPIAELVMRRRAVLEGPEPVSYTHLTLPTNREV